MIGRPIGENHGEQCANADPYWWCDDCRAGLTPEPNERVGFLITHDVDHLAQAFDETEQKS